MHKVRAAIAGCLRSSAAAFGLGAVLLSQGASAAVAARPTGRLVTPATLLAQFDPHGVIGVLTKPWVSWCPKAACVLMTLAGPSGPHLVLLQTSNSGTRDLGPAFAGKLSPDGTMVALITKAFRLRVIQIKPRAVHVLAETELSSLSPNPSLGNAQPGVSLIWSADSHAVAYTAVRDGDRSRYPADTRGMTVQTTDVELLDVGSGKSRRLYSDSGAIFDLQWAAGGRQLVFSYANDNPWNTPVRMMRLDTNLGRTETLRTFDKPYAPYDSAAATLSPDGRYLAFSGDRFAQPTALVEASRFVTDLADGSTKLVDQSFRLTGRTEWDSRRRAFVYACRAEVLVDALCRYSPERASTQVQPIGSPLEAIANWGLSPDGRTVAAQTLDIYGRTRVRVCGERSCRILMAIDPRGGPYAVGRARILHWRAHDGVADHGLLISPVGYRPGRRVPLVVDLHGGPTGGVYLKGSVTFDSPLEWQMWTAMGYAVLVPEYRQSGRLGENQAYLQRQPGRPFLEGSVDDIMSGVDAAVHSGLADPQRLGLVGISWGGVLVNVIITRTQRFKAAVSVEGVSDEAEFNARYPGQALTVSFTFNATPETLHDVLVDGSASTHAADIRTPLLSVRGSESPIGIPTAYAFAEAIRRNGIDAEVLPIQGEGHGFFQPSHVRTVLCTSQMFIRKYLTPDAIEAAKSSEGCS